jgi:hypothetical protein
MIKAAVTQVNEWKGSHTIVDNVCEYNDMRGKLKVLLLLPSQ